MSKSTKVLHFCLSFLSVYNIWAKVTGFNARFKVNSISHTLRLILKMAAIAGMGANAKTETSSLSEFFAFGAFAWGVESISHLEVVYLCIKDPNYKDHLSQNIFFFIVELLNVTVYMCLSCFATTAEIGSIYTAWMVFFLTGTTMTPAIWALFLAKITRALKIGDFNPKINSLPMNVHYVTERFGLFQIIVIGETVIAGSAGFDG